MINLLVYTKGVYRVGLFICVVIRKDKVAQLLSSDIDVGLVFYCIWRSATYLHGRRKGMEDWGLQGLEKWGLQGCCGQRNCRGEASIETTTFDLKI